ncbi:MAG: tetratricopeptide repeat protein, partial [Candidatus Latescibacterota bacterium]
LLKALTEKYPKEKLAHLEMGIYYDSKQQFTDAEKSFLTALALDPKYGEALNGIAYTYAIQKKYDQAITYFGRYAEACPGDVNPLDSMAELYFRMGRLDEAAATYEKVYELKPGFGSERNLAYICALMENYTGALAWMERYIDNAPSAGLAASGRFNKAFFSSMAFNLQDALDDINKARPLLISFGFKFGVAGSYWLEGWIRYELGEYELCRRYLREMISLMEEGSLMTSAFEISLRTLAGLLDLKENLIDDAKARIAGIDSLLALLPDTEPMQVSQKQFETELFRAEVLLAEGRIDDAITTGRNLPEVNIPSMNSALVFFYNFPMNRDVLARAYVRKGLPDDAIEEYERLITFDPAGNDRRLINPKFHYRLGILYEQKGVKDKARQQLQKFIEICGDAEPRLGEVADASRRLDTLSTPRE